MASIYHPPTKAVPPHAAAAAAAADASWLARWARRMTRWRPRAESQEDYDARQW